MSAEEKAVRDALAAVNADTGIQQAQAAIAGTPFGQAQAAIAGTPFGQAQATVPQGNISDITDPKIKAALEALSAGANKLDQQVQTQAGAAGYTYDPVGQKFAPVVDANKSVVDANKVDPLTQLQKDRDDAARKDAFALLADTFKSYGLDSLAETIKGYMTQNIGPNEAALLLKGTQAYKDRFAGNVTRVAAGKNAIDEGTYLALENKYAEVLKAYGQNALGSRAEYANLIGNDISNIELGDRLKLAVTRVQQADPSVKAQLKQFYPNITDADLVSYFLKPDQTLPGLERKVTSAEIGAVATSQGLNTSATSAEDLAAFGVDRSTAIKGYSTIGSILPEATKLSDIYGEAKINYTQKTAEEEVFKGNASAERKRKQLAALESAQFSGSAGVSAAGLSTTYLRKSASNGGQF
jgi:hypothetical protein